DCYQSSTRSCVVLPIEFTEQRRLRRRLLSDLLIRIRGRSLRVSRRRSRRCKPRFLYHLTRSRSGGGSRGYVALTTAQPCLLEKALRWNHRLRLATDRDRSNIAASPARIRFEAGATRQQARSKLAGALISSLAPLCKRAHYRLLCRE